MNIRDRVSIDLKGGVADVRLIRADKMNALDHAMFDGIFAAADQVANDASVRVVVLSGVGKAFCAGLDTSLLSQMAGERTTESMPSHWVMTRKVMSAIKADTMNTSPWAKFTMPMMP